jgi:hypothetical protein
VDWLALNCGALAGRRGAGGRGWTVLDGVGRGWTGLDGVGRGGGIKCLIARKFTKITFAMIRGNESVAASLYIYICISSYRVCKQFFQFSMYTLKCFEG